MRSILARLTRRPPKLDVAHLAFTVYSRKDCGCCVKAHDFLMEQRDRHGFRVETIDVDSDPALVEQFGLSVPVVALDGKVRFRGVINPVLFERLLTAESRGK